MIPPLPSILVNESTQELVSIRCLSNSVVPEASDIACLSVNTDSFSVRASTLFLKKQYIKISFVFQVCELCNGGHSSCSYLFHSDNQMAAKERGESISGVFLLTL